MKRVLKSTLGLLLCASVTQAGPVWSIAQNEARPQAPLDLSLVNPIRGEPGRVHTDVPDLPARSSLIPLRTNKAQVSVFQSSDSGLPWTDWGAGIDAFDVDYMLIDLHDPADWMDIGWQKKAPVLHTDLPDLPPFNDPLISVSPPQDERLIDWQADSGIGPSMLSATVPAPSTLVGLTMLGAYASRRRRTA